MATYAITNEFRTFTVRAVVEDMTIHRQSLYMMAFRGVPFSGQDTVPDELPVTESASIDDIINPLFFKKINLSGANSTVKYVVPDNVNGTITMYSQIYREVPEADMKTEGVRHFFISVEIPKDDILVSDTVRGFGIVADLVDSAGQIATGDSYLASEVDLNATLATPTNWLLYLENAEKFERVSTKAGEQLRAVFAL